ncbi:MAG: hypothetical protein NUV80_01365 [Candidatus Berkelbacteria bacterium]|nr:hypothetical protein [Candidatus Berkelbacteria bacterium]MCR4307190.1 hypothetical protein [Candidatus Berkelbacteria bacterium]
MIAIFGERQDLVRKRSQDYADERILACSQYGHFGQINLAMKEVYLTR